MNALFSRTFQLIRVLTEQAREKKVNHACFRHRRRRLYGIYKDLRVSEQIEPTFLISSQNSSEELRQS